MLRWLKLSDAEAKTATSAARAARAASIALAGSAPAPHRRTPGARAIPASTAAAVRHLRHPLRADEARHLDAGCSPHAVSRSTSAILPRRRDQPRLVLQPVARARPRRSSHDQPSPGSSASSTRPVGRPAPPPPPAPRRPRRRAARSARAPSSSPRAPPARRPAPPPAPAAAASALHQPRHRRADVVAAGLRPAAGRQRVGQPRQTSASAPSKTVTAPAATATPNRRAAPSMRSRELARRPSRRPRPPARRRGTAPARAPRPRPPRASSPSLQPHRPRERRPEREARQRRRPPRAAPPPPAPPPPAPPPTARRGAVSAARSRSISPVSTRPAAKSALPHQPRQEPEVGRRTRRPASPPAPAPAAPAPLARVGPCAISLAIIGSYQGVIASPARTPDVDPHPLRERAAASAVPIAGRKPRAGSSA